MTIPRHTVRAICDLLGIDPNNTAAVAINGIDATITTYDWNGGALTEVTHRIQNKEHRPKMIAEGSRLAMRRPDAIRARDESPIFLETFVLHDGYITKVPPNPWLAKP